SPRWPAWRRLAFTCPYGRSGSLAHCARPFARRSASNRRSTAAASISTRRAAPSTSRALAGRSATRRASACATASGERSPGTANTDGSDVSDEVRTSATRDAPLSGAPIGKAQDQLFAPGKSSRAKYAELVVGRAGLAALLKHELVVLIAQPVPGALGLALRKALYPLLLGFCGRGALFGQNVVLRHPHKIHVGNNVVVDDNCLLDAKGESNRGIRIGDGVFIGRNTILSCKNGDIELAGGVNVGFNCEIFSASRVAIGARTLIAAYAYVIGGDHDF